MLVTVTVLIFFFFNDTATTEIYTLSLHDALPICVKRLRERTDDDGALGNRWIARHALVADRKSTRLNSSHSQISYAVFCLKKKTLRPRGLGLQGAHYGQEHQGALRQGGACTLCTS